MSMDLPPLPIELNPLAYQSQLTARDVAGIDLVVIHCTELPDLATAREFGEKILYPESQTGNSGHFYIDRDGSVHQYVDPAYVAHHTKGFNATSIGIELVNQGRYPDWLDAGKQTMTQAYTDAQIESLIALLRHLRQTIPHLHYIAGHEDLDLAQVPASNDPQQQVRRKMDPGPLFPWARVLDGLPLVRISVPH